MAIISTDNQTAAAPTVEVPVANKTDTPPADETSEPAPAETSKPVSCPPQRQRCSVQTLDPHAPRYLRTTPEAEINKTYSKPRLTPPKLLRTSTPRAWGQIGATRV